MEGEDQGEGFLTEGWQRGRVRTESGQDQSEGLQE